MIGHLRPFTARSGIFHFFHRPDLWYTRFRIEWAPRTFYLGCSEHGATLTSHIPLLSKFENGWSPTSTRNIWFSSESSASSVHFHGEASDEGSQRDVLQYNLETGASAILQTYKQQTEQSHAFYMILRRSNSEQNLTVSSP